MLWSLARDTLTDHDIVCVIAPTVFPHVQPVDVAQLLEGRQPLLKVKLTHLAGGAAILAFTLPHALLGAFMSSGGTGCAV